MSVERFRVGEFEVTPSRDRITGPEGALHVEPRVMAVLEALVARVGEVVSVDDLIREVWHGAAVSNDAVTRCISALRRVFGDTTLPRKVIENVPKKGYRLEPSVLSRSERRPSPGELRSRTTLDAVLRSCTDHIYGYDRDGRYLFVTEAGAAAIGLTPAQMVGKSWRDLDMPAEIMEPFHRLVASVFDGARSVRRTISYPTIYGSRSYEYILDPLRDEKGETFAVLAVVRELKDRPGEFADAEQSTAASPSTAPRRSSSRG